MEENTENFQEMLNIMKVEDFKEVREQKILASAFTQLKRGSNHKAELFHKNTIYAKVLNAFMMARLQSIQYNHRLNIFYEQLQNIYLKIQLQTHFQAMKQFKNIRQQEQNQKINIVITQRMKKQFQSFSNILRNRIFYKKQNGRASAQITPIKEAYKTDNLFYKQRIGRNDFRQAMTKQNFYKKQLQQSRNSVKSAYSISSQLGGRRKFAAIKQLPQFPQIEEIDEKYPIKTEQEQQKQSEQVIKKNSAIPQQKIIYSQNLRTNEQQVRKDRQQKLSKQKPRQNSSAKKYNKDGIIATICKIKMLEVVQLTDIINQYSNFLKYESLINQKAFLSQSKATLQKIIKL